MKRKHIILLIVLAVIAAGAFYGYSEYNRKNVDVAAEKPEFVVNVSAFIKDFEQDSAKASKKYIDKTVLVQGQVKSVDTAGVISLANAGEMSSVQCMMDKRHSLDYSTIKEGSTVSIQGKCNGYQADELLGTDVKMNFCVINNKHL